MARPTEKQLRDERRLGDFFAMSSIDPLARTGERMSARAERRLTAAPLPVGRGMTYNRLTGEYEEIPGFRELIDEQRAWDLMKAHNARQLRLADQRDMAVFQAQLAQAGREAAAGILPTAVRGKVAKQSALITQGQELMQRLAAQPGAVDRWEDLGIEAAGKLPLVGRAAATVLSSATKTADEKAVRASLSKYADDIRATLSGAALTQFEIQNADRWHPATPGLSPAESQRRLAELIRAAEIDREAQLQQYGAVPAAPGAAPAAFGPTPGVTPSVLSAPPPAASGGPGVRSMALGGREYRKRGDTWVEVTP